MGSALVRTPPGNPASRLSYLVSAESQSGMASLKTLPRLGSMVFHCEYGSSPQTDWSSFSETSHCPVAPSTIQDPVPHVSVLKAESVRAFVEHINYDEAGRKGYVLIEPIALALVPDFGARFRREVGYGVHNRFEMRILAAPDVSCI
jgi:hypothetical protein